MAGLLDLPEEVMRQHLFPLLHHNDILRVRRVCKMTKDYANAYLWTPKKGHQGKWTLEIKPSSDDKTFQAFLQMELPPPSRLCINLSSERPTSVNFYEDANLNEFIRIYSKYVTHLTISRIEIPFMSTKEIRFYESLVKLEHFYCDEIKTGGPARFEKKLKMKRSVLLPSTFQRLKTFGFNQNYYWAAPVMTFVRELKSLETIAHVSLDHDYFRTVEPITDVRIPIPFLLSLIEDNGCKLKMIDWKDFHMLAWNWNRLEVLRLFALCSDKEIKFKGLAVDFIEVLLCNENGELDTVEIVDEETRELVYRVNYQRNSFVGNVIHSLDGLDETVFLMESPYLEELLIDSTIMSSFRIWERHGDPKWPNLKKMDITVDNDGINGEHSVGIVDLLCGRVARPKLEEFSLRYDLTSIVNLAFPLPCPLNMVRTFENLKKLRLENFSGNSPFFLTLWEGLRVLEDVELLGCRKLGNRGFIGYSKKRGAVPVFMKLEKLKHLSIGGVHEMPWFTDTVFREVFSRMELKSLKLSGGGNLGKKPKVSVEGIKALLAGKFAETIEELDFDELYLDGLCEDGRKELNSCFRSSKML